MGKNFRKNYPLEWSDSDEYLNNGEKILKIKSVNDAAERVVKLIVDYNNLLSLKEDQKEFIAQL